MGAAGRGRHSPLPCDGVAVAAAGPRAPGMEIGPRAGHTESRWGRARRDTRGGGPGAGVPGARPAWAPVGGVTRARVWCAAAVPGCRAACARLGAAASCVCTRGVAHTRPCLCVCVYKCIWDAARAVRAGTPAAAVSAGAWCLGSRRDAQGMLLESPRPAWVCVHSQRQGTGVGVLGGEQRMNRPLVSGITARRA